MPLRLFALLLVLFAPLAPAQEETEDSAPATPVEQFSASVSQAMTADIRSEAEVERDENRLPVETLAFFGLEPDMRVLELIPGGGWYTKLLAPALYENGELHVALGTGGVKENLLDQPGFDRVVLLEPEVQAEPTDTPGIVNIPPLDLGVEDLDAVLTFRNMHNLTEQARGHLNAAVFEALAPGGVYGIIDHTRRHMEEDSGENRRRADPVQIIKEVQAAGFVFEDYSDLHFRLDDELRYEVGRRSVAGNTDRFTLRFRKPE